MRRIAGVALIVTVVTGVLVACHQGTACAEELAAVRPPAPPPRPPAPRPTPRPSTPRVTSAPKPTPRPTSPRPTARPGASTPRSNVKPPRTVSLRPRGIDPRTSFGRTFRDPRSRVVFVYHDTGFYGTPTYWALHQRDYLMDPYFRGGFWLGRYYPPNYLNPLSRWYHHPMFLSASCRTSGGDFPRNEQPDPAPVNVNITNEIGDRSPPTTVDTTIPPESTTTTSTPGTA
jgi:hypothetical protein